MIFADKLIQLRKKAGWLQEELAVRMDVTRQSVSKWEGAQSAPDLEKMIRLSELFGVSTDYLLKDDIEEAQCIHSFNGSKSIRYVSMEEAEVFLSVRAKTAQSIACAAVLCIISPTGLLLLGAASESLKGRLDENIAGGVGMIILIALIAAAAAVFIASGSKMSSFSYMEEEIFETESGVREMIKERREQYRGLHEKNKITGACLCITALIPFFAGVVIDADNDLFLVIMLSVSFFIAGIGTAYFVKTGMIWAGYEKLLQEGEYSRANRGKRSFSSAVYVTYWIIAATVYLGYSLFSNRWSLSWIIWVVAGTVFPALVVIMSFFEKNQKKM